MGHTLLTVLTVDVLATSGDIAATWTSPILPKLRSNDTSINPFNKPITTEEESWIGSLLSIGAMIGPFLYIFVSEKFGRRKALLCIAVPHIVSYLTLAFAKTVYLYYFARVLGGIAVGGGYALLPTYVAEVADDSTRGRLSSTLNIFWTFGNLIPYLIGPFLSVLWFNLILACVPTTFLVLFFLIVPESPRYLVVKNKIEEAEKVLMKLRSQEADLVEEIREMQMELSENQDSINLALFLRSKVYMKGLLISFLLIIAQQLSGINAVLFYTQEIFQDAGTNGLPAEVSSIIIGLVTFASSFITPFVVDKWGRRPLMLISLVGLTITLLVFGVYFYFKSAANIDLQAFFSLFIISVIAYIIMFNTGLGPLAWTISSELFPTKVKSYSSSLISFVSWTLSFLVTKFFSDMVKSIGEAETFWLFSGCCLCAFVLTLVFLPETKGRSFQDIQKILGGSYEPLLPAISTF